MRNLKRALSLTLASVMLLGMMVVGSNAAAGYDDVKETDNVEAIEVLQAVEVMVGDERGFGPDRPVSRAEMAVVMGKLLNLDYNYYASTCPFTDVSGNYDWARGWVGACAANGIVSGRGNGVYDPAATVTAVEAASMMMRALGYFKYTEDYADGFVTATVRQGSDIGIFNGVGTDGTTPMTRNQVAQMALNALRSEVVIFTGTPSINVNGVSVGYRAEYTPRTSTEAKYNAIEGRTSDVATEANHKGQYYIQLGEQLYDGKLKLNNKAVDVFGRPSRYWEYDSKEIGTYVKQELIREEYTVKVTGKTLYELLGKTILDDYDLDVYIDGVDNPDANKNVFDRNSLVRTNDKAVGDTGKGVLTQVFLDPDQGSNGLITIAIINTYLAKADEDYDDRTEDVDVTVYGIDEIPGFKNEFWKTADIDTDDGRAQHSEQKYGFKLEVEDFPEVVDVKDGDFFLVNVAEGEIQTLGQPEVLSKSQISTFKQGSYVITGGTQYDFADSAEYDWETLYMYTEKGSGLTNLKDITYNVYLDQYGYAIGVEEVDREDNYLFITGVDTNTNNRYAVQADATAIFLDGTMASIKIDMKAVRDLRNDKIDKGATDDALNNGDKGGSLVNRWFTYSVDADGVYDVVLVGDYTRIDDKSINARAAQWCVTMEKDHDDAKNGVNEIGPKSIALRGTDKPDSTWYSVYGDDQSVYITAELDTIQDATTAYDRDVNVISGVDNVVVGVDNASIDIWTIATAASQGQGVSVNDTAYGAYTLFDKDGDIIAAVVVGEDSGATTNLVYTHEKKLESETDNNVGSSRANVKGDYTWTRKVVSGSTGKEILLTEVGSGLSKLKNMEPNTWYVVKYNAKGEVKNVYPAWDTYSYSNGKIATSYKGLIDAPARNADGTVIASDANEVTRLEDRYVNDIEELNRATNENTTVLYEVGQYNTGDINGDTTTWDGKAVGDQILWYGGKPSVDNHTFYMNTATSQSKHQGFRVSDDVQTVFIQTNNNDTTTTFESGYSRLEKVVDRLHDHAETNRSKWTNPDTYHYEVSAVMENSKAIVVVIRDLNDAGADIRPIDRAQELRLYGTLFTSPNGTVTGNSDTVVTVDDKVVEPSGIETDMGGSYTIYHIQPGKTVSITDWDIQETTFKSITNMTWAANDYREIKNQRTITFTMPNRTAIVVGSETTANTGDVKITIDNKDLSNLDAMFLSGGKTVSSLANQTVGGLVDVVIGTDLRAFTGIEANAKYTVNLGTPGENYTGTANAAGTRIVVNDYRLTAFDVWSGYVTVNNIEKIGSEVEFVTVPTVDGVAITDANGENVEGKQVAIGTKLTITIDDGKTASFVDQDGKTITLDKSNPSAPYTIGGKGLDITVKDDVVIGEDTAKVTVAAVVGGTASVEVSGLKDGVVNAGEVTVTVTNVESGKEVKSIVVTDKAGTEVADVTTSTCTFTAVKGEEYTVTVTVGAVGGNAGDVTATVESGKATITLPESAKKDDKVNVEITIPESEALTAEGDDATYVLLESNGSITATSAARIEDGKFSFSYTVSGTEAGKKVNFTVTPVVPDGLSSNGKRIFIYEEIDGNFGRRFYPILPATISPFARAISDGFELEEGDEGSVSLLTIGTNKYYGVTKKDAKGNLYEIFPEAEYNAVREQINALPIDPVTGTRNIPEPVFQENNTTKVPAIDSTAKTITVDMGAPLVQDAKLPTEIVVDNALAFSINWYCGGTLIKPDKDGNVFATNANLKGYKAYITLTKAEDATVDVTGYTIMQDGYKVLDGSKVTAEALEQGIVVDENGGTADSARDVMANITFAANKWSATFLERTEITEANAANIPAMKEADVVKALNASKEAKAKGWNFSLANVDLTNNKAVADNNAVTVEWSAQNNDKPNKAYLITYPGGTTYVTSAGATVDDVVLPTGIKAMIPSEAPGANSTGNGAAVSVVDGKTATVLLPKSTTSGEYADREYVAAVALDATTTAIATTGLVHTGLTTDDHGASGNYNVNFVKAYIVNPKNNQPMLINTDSVKYVMVGGVIELRQELTAATNPTSAITGRKTLAITVNGEEYSTFDTDKEGKIATVQKVTVERGDRSGVLTLTVAIKGAEASKDEVIYVGSANEPITKDATSGNYIVPNMIDAKGNVLSLVYWDAANKKWEKPSYTASVVPSGNSGVLTLDATDFALFAGAENDNGQYHVRRAWSVTDATDEALAWTAYLTEADAKAGTNAIAKTAKYFPVDEATTIYVKAPAGVALSKAGADYKTPLSTGAGAADPTMTDAVIYTVEVDGNINKDSYEALVSFTANATATITATSNGAVDLDVAGLSFKEGVKVKRQVLNIEDADTVSDCKVVLTSGKKAPDTDKNGTTLTVKLTVKADLDGGAIGELATVATVEVELSTGELFTLTVKGSKA